MASNSVDKVLYFQEARDLYKFNHLQCEAIFTCSWAQSRSFV